MDSLNPKRPRHVPSISSSTQNPSSLPTAPGSDESKLDSTISSFLSLSESPLLSSPLSIGCTFDRVIEKVITSAIGDEFDQDRFLDRTHQLASILQNSSKRCIKKRATIQNSISWPLPSELTTKVFSLLDTKSLAQTSSCCTIFNKCAKDSVCYTHIDLTKATKPVDNRLVCIMVGRAGKELRSLKLGSISPPSDGTTKSLLTRSCLTPLTSDNGFAGGLLKSLHLYNLDLMDRKSLCAVLSACPNLTDLKIVGFVPGDRFDPLKQLVLLTKNCRLIEQLHLETSSSVDLKETDSTVEEFVDNCPNLTSLSLLRFGVDDEIAETIIKGFPQLKHLNLSRTTRIHGYFLRCEELNCSCSLLETLILRNCYGLKESEVSMFLNSILEGDFQSIRYIDVSNGYGVATNRGRRTFNPNYPTEELRKQRPDVTLVVRSPPSPSLPTSSSSSSSRALPLFGRQRFNSLGSSMYLSEDEEEDDEEY